ncbi:MAG: hypothetical protein Q8K62_04455 [Thiobacillus sp.]|nr:hypothetical protein [Thiobacillus sp.]
MIFTEDFLESLLTDPIRGAAKILDIVRFHLSEGEGWGESDHEALLEAYALVSEMLESNLLPLEINLPQLTGNTREDSVATFHFLSQFNELCKAEASILQVESLRSRFRVAIGKGFAYEFSQGDLERVQNLINELRDQLSTNISLEHDHKQRLLRRLERLQAELHKKVSDLDRFWGLIGDAGVVLGKLGNDAKPIVDRIREIADIVWQTQSRAEELPSGTHLPSLEYKPEGENKG